MGRKYMKVKRSNVLLLLIFLMMPVGICAMEQEEEIKVDGMNLIEASKSGQKDIIVSLIKKGSDIEAVNRYGWTALMRATNSGHIEIVKYLIEKGANIETIDNGGWAALMWAAANGHTEIVKYLIEKGANIDAVDNYYGWTALISAAFNDHTEIVKYLIKKGAKIDAVDNDGWTALMRAIERGSKNTISQLLEHGADPYIKNKEGKNSLDFAGDDQELKNHIIRKHREYKKKCVEHLAAFLQKGGAKNGQHWERDEDEQNENGLHKNKKCGPFEKDIALHIAGIRYGVSEDEWQQMCRDGNG